MKKTLLTGSDGQLATSIMNMVKKEICFNNIELLKMNSLNLDITDKKKVNRVINRYRPNIIINTAAYTNVDQSEEDYEKAFQVNSLGPRNLALAAESIGAKLIHISTDYVFDGNGNTKDSEIMPYREYDTPNPQNIYGQTKLLGENYIREFCSKYFIIRTSWLYGQNGNNFVKTIIKLGKEKGKLEVVNDQFGNPTNAEDLAHHILKIAMTDEYGIYHCTGNGICSWYDFAKKIIEYANIDCIVEPIRSNVMKRKAKRPKYSALDNMMLRCTIGDNMRNWEEALYDFIKNKLKI